MGEPIFVIRVELDACTAVTGTGERVNFLRFHGTADSAYFHGDILPGGVDCQRQAEHEPMRLSARYVMEGVDCTGRACRVFIENNGREAAGGMRTVPEVVTDSEVLSGLTQGALYGEIDGKGDGAVEIRIYAGDAPSGREADKEGLSP